MQNGIFSPSAACAAFTASLRYEDLPEDVIDFVKKDTLDWVGCAIGGCADPSSAPIKKVSELLGGNAQSQAMGLPRQNVILAAMCNAYFGHILEMDDVDRDSISHPATVNIAPALAVAEFKNRTGRDLITGVTAGFETMLRIGAAITPAHYKIFHTTATTGVFGSAMAAGKLLGLNEKQLLWALGNAGTVSAGLWQFLQDGGMSKFLHTAEAAGNGILVALLAENGFTGATRILEGTQGFFAGYARQDIDEDLFKDFGEKWRTALVSFKPYPCCRHTHSAIDAGFEIRNKLKGRGIDSIKLYTYTTAMQVAGNRSPRTQRGAKFSVPYCVASSILRGLPGEKDFADSAVQEPAVQALEKKIEVIIDEDLNVRVPKNWPCRIEVIADDGEFLSAQVWSPKGDPENSLSWDAVSDKFRMLTDGIIPAGTQDQLIDLCHRLETLDSVESLLRTVNQGLNS